MMNDAYLRVTALATRQHGAFSWEQAAAAGMSASALARRTRNGILTRPYPSVYLVGGSAATWERAVSAAVLSCGPAAVASHATACHLLDLAKRPRTIEVTTTATGVPRRSFVVHRSTDLMDEDVMVMSGIRSTNPARTLVDVGIPWGGEFADRCLSEAVRRGLVTDLDVARVLYRVARRGRSGVGPMRLVLMTRLGWTNVTESQMEDEFLRIMIAAGVEIPEAQVQMRNRGGRIVARVDYFFRQANLVVALDGEAYHSDRESFRKDRRQQNEIVLEGRRVLRFTAWDIFVAPEYVVAQVAAALQQAS